MQTQPIRERLRRAYAELTPDAIEQIAQRVTQLLRHDQHDIARAPQRSGGLMDAGQLARHLRVTRAWVYQHADELGAIRVGAGPRARLRFDPDTVAAALGAERKHEPSRSSKTPAARTRPSARPAPSTPLLPVTPRRVRGIMSRLTPSRRSRTW